MDGNTVLFFDRSQTHYDATREFGCDGFRFHKLVKVFALGNASHFGERATPQNPAATRESQPNSTVLDETQVRPAVDAQVSKFADDCLVLVHVPTIPHEEIFCNLFFAFSFLSPLPTLITNHLRTKIFRRFPPFFRILTQELTLEPPETILPSSVAL